LYPALKAGIFFFAFPIRNAFPHYIRRMAHCLQPSEFQDVSGDALAGWNGIGEICLSPGEDLKATVNGKRTTRRLGGGWQGATPEFRDLRWEPVPATAKPAR
jgi:hypothetical protein